MATERVKRLIKNLGNSRTFKEAAIKAKYSKNYAEEPHQIKNTEQFKKESKPILERYKKELNAILDAMELKDKNSEEYKVLIDATDKVQKLIQLLSGGATERTEGKIIIIQKSNENGKNQSSSETESSVGNMGIR